jgi:hypothetical protein
MDLSKAAGWREVSDRPFAVLRAQEKRTFADFAFDTKTIRRLEQRSLKDRWSLQNTLFDRAAR